MLKSYYRKNTIEAGCDEAGRGCMAGPVFAAAVILPKDYRHKLLDDSKKISEKNRNILRKHIEKNAMAWAIGQCSEEEIDELNILNASFLAMHRAVDALRVNADLLLIDGNRFNQHPIIQHECFIKGDGRFKAIAAASILAKTHRDEHMQKLHEYHKIYQWNVNKGYGTKHHRQMMTKFGVTSYHRKTFKFKPLQTKLDI